MSQRIPINFPKGGLSDDKAFSEQEAGTTREAQNVRVRDPRTGRMRGAQRSGLSEFSTALSGANPVRDLQMIVTDTPRIVFEDDPLLPLDVGTTTPGLRSAHDCGTDSQGNLWVVDGEGLLLHYNSELTLLRTINLPLTPSSETLVRRVLVDELDAVYAASSHVNGEAGRIWRYTLNEEGTPELAWALDVDGSVAAMEYRAGVLYVGINHAGSIVKSTLSLYAHVFTSIPSLQWQKAVPSPFNDMTVNSAGSVVTAHAANANRAPESSTAELEDSAIVWTPNETVNSEDRIYGWWDASTLTGYADGDEVTLWPERRTLADSPEWVAPNDTTDRSFRRAALSTRKGPTYMANGVGPGSLPTLKFESAVSAGTGSLDSPGNGLVTFPNASSAPKGSITQGEWPNCRAMLPGGVGAGGNKVSWTNFMVVQYEPQGINVSSGPRGLWAQAGSPANYGMSGWSIELMAGHSLGTVSPSTYAIASVGADTVAYPGAPGFAIISVTHGGENGTPTKAAGNVNFVGVPNPGESLEVNDGRNPEVSYLFTTTPGADTPILQHIDTTALNATTVATALFNKINAPTAGCLIEITATNGTGTEVDLLNDRWRHDGNESLKGPLTNATIEGMVGGITGAELRVNGEIIEDFIFTESANSGLTSYTVLGHWYWTGTALTQEFGQTVDINPEVALRQVEGFTGHVCEIITVLGSPSADLHDVPLTLDEIEKVESYLASKWGIPDVLPFDADPLLSHRYASGGATPGPPASGGTGGSTFTQSASELALQSVDPILAKWGSSGELVWALSAGGVGLGVAADSNDDLLCYGQQVVTNAPGQTPVWFGLSNLEESAVSYRKVEDLGASYVVDQASAGTIQVLSGTLAGETVTVSDGTETETFEFDTLAERSSGKIGLSGVAVAADNYVIPDGTQTVTFTYVTALTGGDTATSREVLIVDTGNATLDAIATLNNVATAINDASYTFKVSAGAATIPILPTTLSLKHDDLGSNNNVITANGATLTKVDWALGVAANGVTGANLMLPARASVLGGVQALDEAISGAVTYSTTGVRIALAMDLTTTVIDPLQDGADDTILVTKPVVGNVSDPVTPALTYTILSSDSNVIAVTGFTTGQDSASSWVAERVEDATYLTPRVAVDSLDNFYVPQADTGVGKAMVTKRLGSTGEQAWGYSADPLRTEGFAVAFPPVGPNFGVLPDLGPEHVYVVSSNLNSGVLDQTIQTIRKVQTLKKDRTTGGPREMTLLGVSNGDIVKFTKGGVPEVVASGGAGALDAASSNIQSAVLFDKVYYVDGLREWLYDAKALNARKFKAASSGELPKRCRGITAWNGRLVMFRSADDPNNWYMSRQGDPFNWDYFPPVPSSQMAVSGDSRPEIGKNPDLITAFIPYTDDLAIIGGDHTIHRMNGDPAAGGQIDLVSDQHGVAFGTAWTKDPEGRIYFMSQRGGVVQMDPGGSIRRISVHRIEERLRAVDQSAVRVELEWNYEDEGLHVLQMNNVTGVLRDAWFWEAKADAWFSDTFPVGVQPTSALVVDGDLPADRTLLFGCEDGVVRYWDKAAVTDGSARIDSRVLIGPIAPKDTPAEIRFSGLETVLSKDQGGARYEWFATDRSDSLGSPVSEGELAPGRNPSSAARAKGSSAWLRIYNAGPTAWALEEASVMASPAGRKRVRS